jgi:hypothetical protein
MYKLILNNDGIPCGFIDAEDGSLTEEQAQAAILCGKENPTSNEVELAISAQQAEYAAKEYKRNRAKEYPDFRDYLDGIVKGDTAQVQAYIDACNAVKAKYPKG